MAQSRKKTSIRAGRARKFSRARKVNSRSSKSPARKLSLFQTQKWNLLISGLLAVLLIFFIAELAGLLNEQMLSIFAGLEVITIIALAADLYYKYKHTDKKRDFVRKNWLSIFMLLPASIFAVGIKMAGTGARAVGLLGSTSEIAATDLRLGTISMSAFARGMSIDSLVARLHRAVGSLHDALSVIPGHLRRKK